MARCWLLGTPAEVVKWCHTWFAFGHFPSYLCCGKGSTRVLPFFVDVAARGACGGRIGMWKGLRRVVDGPESQVECGPLRMWVWPFGCLFSSVLTFCCGWSRALYFWRWFLCQVRRKLSKGFLEFLSYTFRFIVNGAENCWMPPFCLRGNAH